MELILEIRHNADDLDRISLGILLDIDNTDLNRFN